MAIFMLCLKIFFCRILDVSLATIRTIFTVKRKPVIAGLLGFVEVFIWFLVVKDALNTEINSIWIPIAYAGGYGTGTLIGGIIAKFISKPKVNMQIITTHHDHELLEKLKQDGIPMTVLDAVGEYNQTEKYLIYIQIEEKYANYIKSKIKELDPTAFILVSDITSYNGYQYNGK